MPADDRSISEFPIAQQLLNTALVLVSNEDGQGGYDSYKATLTELGRVVLETQYTQDLGNMDVFTAIKNCRTLSGASDPTSQQGADGQLYVKYQTVNNVTSVTGLFVKLSGEWVEISTGGGGDVGIECTQAQYDAWEQAGTLFADTNYYITDGQSGGGVTIDDTTASSSTVYSSDKVEDLLSDKQDATDNSLTTTDKTIVGAINEVNSGLSDVKAYRCKYDYTSWGTSKGSEFTHVPFFRIQIDLDYYIASNGGDYINIRNIRTGTTQGGQIPSGQTSVSVTVDGYTFTKNVSEGKQNLVITTSTSKPIFIEYYL